MLCAASARTVTLNNWTSRTLTICLALMAIRSTLVLRDFVTSRRSDHDTLHRKWQRWLTDDYPVSRERLN